MPHSDAWYFGTFCHPAGIKNLSLPLYIFAWGLNVVLVFVFVLVLLHVIQRWGLHKSHCIRSGQCIIRKWGFNSRWYTPDNNYAVKYSNFQKLTCWWNLFHIQWHHPGMDIISLSHHTSLHGWPPVVHQRSHQLVVLPEDSLLQDHHPKCCLVQHHQQILVLKGGWHYQRCIHQVSNPQQPALLHTGIP